MITLPSLKSGPTKTIFADLAQHPNTIAPEIAARTGIERSAVVHVLSYLEVAGYAQKHRVGAVQRGNHATWLAIAEEAEPFLWPVGLKRELPSVRAALPVDRSLRPHVGIVILLDQQRRAA